MGLIKQKFEVIESFSHVSLKGDCVFCGKNVVITMLKISYDQWKNGAYIQDAAPYLNPGQREFLISKICEPCFDKMWKE